MKTPGQRWRDDHPESTNECAKKLPPACKFAGKTLYGYYCHSYWPERCQWYCGEPKKEQE